jgi:hypothetical protein
MRVERLQSLRAPDASMYLKLKAEASSGKVQQRYSSR